MEKYSRQILFPGIGAEGQRKLLASHVALIGCGALGTVQAESLVRAGVGHLLIVDRDFVEESNLQRQVLFDEEDARQGWPKAVAAERKLKQINSEVMVRGLVEDVNYTNIEEIVAGADLILDATDNFETRFLINDVSVKHKIPWVYGACVSSYGVSMTVVPERTPCLRCVFQTAPGMGEALTCETAGIISPIVNVIASIQVCEALKILTGNLDRLTNQLVNFDLWEGKLHLVDVAHARNDSCPTCVGHNYEHLRGHEGSDGIVLCGRNAVQIHRLGGERIELAKLAESLRRVGEVRFNEFLLKLKVHGYEITVFPDGRGIVKGTEQLALAKSLFAKYIGL